jgi:hypothetical protein
LEEFTGRAAGFFPGLLGSSDETAGAVKRLLLSLGATVPDWKTDFIPGRTIPAQIEQAAARCIGSIFLFTRDDDLVDNGQIEKSVPRDNVVFEAGYFIGQKGKSNVLSFGKPAPKCRSIWAVTSMLRCGIRLILVLSTRILESFVRAI